jgi:hypothetical protein
MTDTIPPMEINGKPTVICRVCDACYTEGVMGDAQANDCAAMYVRRGDRHFVVCCYGSDFDTEAFEILVDVEIWQDADPICDDCIRRAVEEGWLVRVPGEYPWGLYVWPSGIIGKGAPVEITPPPAIRSVA